MFVHTLTVDGKYFCHNRENLSQPIQMQLSKNPKTFSQILLRLWNIHKIRNFLIWDQLSWGTLLLVSLKSYDCLLTHWLSKASFLVIERRIYRHQYKWNQLKKKLFVKILLRFWNITKIWNFFRKPLAA